MVTLYNKENFEINLEINNDNFSKPFIIYDSLIEEKIPDIKYYDSKEAIDFLNEKGFCIWAEEIDSKNTWAIKQKYILHLKPSNLPLGDTFKKLKSLPPNHYIQIDINNNRARLYGDFISPQTKFTPWVNY